MVEASHHSSCSDSECSSHCNSEAEDQPEQDVRDDSAHIGAVKIQKILRHVGQT